MASKASLTAAHSTRKRNISLSFWLSVILWFSHMSQAQAYREEILYRFENGQDGAYPYAGVILDEGGNLYGITSSGGNPACDTYGCGVIFRLDKSGNETVLYSFGDQLGDGEFPEAGFLARDATGNFYGTTYWAGPRGCHCGTVFKLDPSGRESVLYSFTGKNGDGYSPEVGVIVDNEGNVYGTTSYGGDFQDCPWTGCGIVYKVTPSGQETVLHGFSGSPDGAYPITGLVRDEAGNLYGTTIQGGAFTYGTVFRIDPRGQETVLHSFRGAGVDGEYPQDGTMVLDEDNNLYGTTYQGGTYGGGVVFKLDTTTGKQTVLYNFSGGEDGAFPYAGLVRDRAGNFYGTTYQGGTYNLGVVFKLDRKGRETVLYRFAGTPDGAHPFAGLVIDAAGNLYGTTKDGGSDKLYNGGGTVFKLIPNRSTNR